MSEKMKVKILYTNHKGETAIRHIIPKRIEFLSNQWHPTEQWTLVAHDLDKNAERAFAMSHIKAWWTD